MFNIPTPESLLVDESAIACSSSNTQINNPITYNNFTQPLYNAQSTQTTTNDQSTHPMQIGHTNTAANLAQLAAITIPNASVPVVNDDFVLELVIRPSIPDNISINQLRWFYHPDGWEDCFRNPTNEKDWLEISSRIEQDEREGYDIFPRRDEIFNAFRCKPSDTKVVIIGQDPYPSLIKIHQHDKLVTRPRAMGMAFSAPRGDVIPKSLSRMFYELQLNSSKYPDLVSFTNLNDKDLHPDLTYWADQGVLLLNTSLTVRYDPNNPNDTRNSHKGLWLGVISRIITTIQTHNSNCIYVLWGAGAKTLSGTVRRSKYVLEAAHPSPVNTRGGFIGCEHFSKINDILINQLKKTPIDWNIYHPWELAERGYAQYSNN